MKATRGRLGSFPFIFKYYLKDSIMISLSKEKVSIFPDGSIRRTKKYIRNKNK